MTSPPSSSPMPRGPVSRPPAWLTDPLDEALLRYWDGARWTFHTAERPSVAPEPTPAERESAVAQHTLRPDVRAALERVRGGLLGSKKEIELLGKYLKPEERVLALTGATGNGVGVLACTDRRLLFLFVGLLDRQFLDVNWNETRAITYDQSTRFFAVYTTKPTRRAVPAMKVRVYDLKDAETVAYAAQEAAAAPRLDVV